MIGLSPLTTTYPRFGRRSLGIAVAPRSFHQEQTVWYRLSSIWQIMLSPQQGCVSDPASCKPKEEINPSILRALGLAEQIPPVNIFNQFLVNRERWDDQADIDSNHRN